ncbi:MAG: Retron-type RNA-directed DNA polymerase [Candidatus Jettenia ecosi]|uniref:Retron-type RNA-directed DNA polymerase n=1 Tax=Candidatus Jettenia ecosi TaxID=2494326 RepID=A0A533Q640_9BACT|nr:MAG: Retron-type RNA-directed DNA polymerase [Candidatus Jettenia ecosi]
MVPFEDKRQHNPVRGKESCFVHATEEWRKREIAEMLTTPEKIRILPLSQLQQSPQASKRTRSIAASDTPVQTS